MNEVLESTSAGNETPTDSARANRIKILVTVMHLACIAAFVAVLFCGIDGQRQVFDDDLQLLRDSTPYQTKDYLWLVRHRRFLNIAYISLYHLAGQSLVHANELFMGLYAISVVLAYIYLRSLVSPALALLGSLFYLAYSSKYEPLTIWACGFYLLMWCWFLTLLLFFDSKIGERIKSVGVAISVWLSLHLFEVLFLVAPMLSLFSLWRVRCKNGRLTKGDVVFALLPIAVCVVHATILLTSPYDPIFFKNFAAPEIAHASAPAKLTYGFKNSFEATVGPPHFSQVRMLDSSFLVYTRHMRSLRYLIGLCAILLAAALAISFKSLGTITIKREELIAHALLGAAVFACAGWTSCLRNPILMPPRQTGIPIIGLMIMLVCIAGLLLDRSLKRNGARLIANTFGFCAIAALIAWTGAELAALSATLRMTNEMSTDDQKVFAQIKELCPNFRKDDSMVIRRILSVREIQRAWVFPWSASSNTDYAVQLVSSIYGIPLSGHEQIKCIGRYDSSPHRQWQIFSSMRKMASESKIYAFDVDPQGIVAPIKQVQLISRGIAKKPALLTFCVNGTSAHEPIVISLTEPVSGSGND